MVLVVEALVELREHGAPAPLSPAFMGGRPVGARAPARGQARGVGARRAPDSPIALSTRGSQTGSVHRFVASKEPGIYAPTRSAHRANGLSSRPPPDLRDHARPQRGSACQTPGAHNASTPTRLRMRCFGPWECIPLRGVARQTTSGRPGALGGGARATIFHAHIALGLAPAGPCQISKNHIGA